MSPVISGDGQSLFFGVTRAGVQGWWENRFGKKPWTVELDKDPVVGKARELYIFAFSFSMGFSCTLEEKNPLHSKRKYSFFLTRSLFDQFPPIHAQPSPRRRPYPTIPCVYTSPPPAGPSSP